MSKNPAAVQLGRMGGKVKSKKKAAAKNLVAYVRQSAKAEELERCVKILEFHGHTGMANALRETLP